MARPYSRRQRRTAFAARLRQARKRLGLTQEGAAKALSVTRVCVARWETGTRAPSGPARLYVEAWINHALGKE